MKLNEKISFLIIILLVIGLTFFITPIKGITRDGTVSTVAEKDAYVTTYNPTSNYGGKDWLIFGNYITGWNEAYLYFSFSEKPAGWTKAEISIDMYSVSETFILSVSLINDNWDEYTINWVNKPIHRETITTFTVSEGKIYKIDITDYIEGRGSISICVNASNYLQNGYVQGTSREGVYSWSQEDAPQLIWTYPENDYSTLIYIVGGAFIIIIVGALVILRKRKNERINQNMQNSKAVQKYRISPTIQESKVVGNYCQNCGHKNTIPNSKFCINCGDNLNI